MYFPQLVHPEDLATVEKQVEETGFVFSLAQRTEEYRGNYHYT
jgi:hypothetical protein